MSLYRVGKTWYVDLSSEGGRVRRSTGTTDKRQAQAYHERLRNELWEQDKLGKPPAVTWGEAVRKWVEEKNPGMPSRYQVRGLSIPLASTLPLSAERLKESTTHYSTSSWNRCLSLVKMIHVCSGVSVPKLERRASPPGRTRWLDEAEWKRLQKELLKESPLLEQAARFTLATGLRENNVLNLEWAQVDMKRRLAYLHADQVKNRSALGVRLNSDAIAVLHERKGQNKRWVFAHPYTGKPLYKASMRAWYTAVRKAKLTGFRWHDLRHTWASWHVMNGTSLMELKEMGGWKTLSMVARYSHLSTDHLAEAAERVKPVSR